MSGADLLLDPIFHHGVAACSGHEFHCRPIHLRHLLAKSSKRRIGSLTRIGHGSSSGSKSGCASKATETLVGLTGGSKHAACRSVTSTTKG